MPIYDEFFRLDENGQFKDMSGYFLTDEKCEELILLLVKYRAMQGKDSANKEIEEFRKREMEEMEKNKKIEKEKKRKKQEDGYVYFVESEHGGVKIGKTTNLKTRFKALQSASPFKLKLIRAIKGPDIGNYELYVHEYFKDKRMEGEWFDISDEDIKNFMIKEGIINE